MTDASFNPCSPKVYPKEESSRRNVPIADLVLWHGRLRVIAAALYDMDYSSLSDQCWQLAGEIEATANPIFEEE